MTSSAKSVKSTRLDTNLQRALIFVLVAALALALAMFAPGYRAQVESTHEIALRTCTWFFCLLWLINVVRFWVVVGRKAGPLVAFYNRLCWADFCAFLAYAQTLQPVRPTAHAMNPESTHFFTELIAIAMWAWACEKRGEIKSLIDNHQTDQNIRIEEPSVTP